MAGRNPRATSIVNWLIIRSSDKDSRATLPSILKIMDSTVLISFGNIQYAGRYDDDDNKKEIIIIIINCYEINDL